MKMSTFLNEINDKTDGCDFDCETCVLHNENDCLLREPEGWTVEFKPNKYAEIEKTLMYDSRALFQINEKEKDDEKIDNLMYILLCLISFLLIILIAAGIYLYLAFKGTI